MSLFEIFVIAVGLAMDCFAVSVSSGVVLPKVRIKLALRLAFFFGLFQGGMALLGWFFGTFIKDFFSAIDHWIAFIILLIIGLKMIIAALKEKPGTRSFNINKMFVVLALSVATSIDALIVGTSFGILTINIWKVAGIIAIVSFIMSIIGIYAGKKYGCYCGNKGEIIGGIILILIGLKVLLEHLEILTF